ncbi:MAG: chromosomal replication initiator protein DnaA, partial [Actinobacteria bacterium]|nr:chromosomal replication initiator protein DnaA [Actinomycetota bacterium]
MLSQHTWDAAVGALQVAISKAEFAAWFAGSRFVGASDGELVIGVPTVFAKETLDRRYRDLLGRTVSGVSGGKVAVTVVVRPELAAADAPALALPAPPDERAPSGPGEAPLAIGLHPRFTFANFVVGNTNRLAHAAALRISESPGAVYNPLFVYSGVGLGKTHLLHAVGHAFRDSGAFARVLYVSCETFTNDLLVAIRTDVRAEKTRRFRERYRTVDALLIDDVQFLSRSETAQEELFHTFNALYEAGRQIVLASDRRPAEIAALADRLRSRFEAGLVADIQPPDLDLRRAILQRRASALNCRIPAEVIDYLAGRVRRNVRELEGALTRTQIYAELSGLPLTPETAAVALDGLRTPDADRPPSAERVLKLVGEHFEVT